MEDKELEKIKKKMFEKLLRASDSQASPWIKGTVINLSSSNFNDALEKASKPVLVDFWAE